MIEYSLAVNTLNITPTKKPVNRTATNPECPRLGIHLANLFFLYLPAGQCMLGPLLLQAPDFLRSRCISWGLATPSYLRSSTSCMHFSVSLPGSGSFVSTPFFPSLSVSCMPMTLLYLDLLLSADNATTTVASEVFLAPATSSQILPVCYCLSSNFTKT